VFRCRVAHGTLIPQPHGHRLQESFVAFLRRMRIATRARVRCDSEEVWWRTFELLHLHLMGKAQAPDPPPSFGHIPGWREHPEFFSHTDAPFPNARVMGSQAWVV